MQDLTTPVCLSKFANEVLESFALSDQIRSLLFSLWTQYSLLKIVREKFLPAFVMDYVVNDNVVWLIVFLSIIEDYQYLQEYTANQMITLLNVATHVSKKARTRLINALDEWLPSWRK